MIVDVPDLAMFFFYRAWDKESKPVIIRLVETIPTMRLSTNNSRLYYNFYQALESLKTTDEHCPWYLRIIPHEPNVVVSRI